MAIGWQNFCPAFALTDAAPAHIRGCASFFRREHAGVELALDDAKVAGELGVIASHLVEEPLGVLAPDQHLDRVPERMVEAASFVADDVDDHRGGDVTAASFVA
jgi:hypothetical protein